MEPEFDVQRTVPMELGETWAWLLALVEQDPAVGPTGRRTERLVARFPYLIDQDGDHQATLQVRVRPAEVGTTLDVHAEGLPDESTRRSLRSHWISVLNTITQPDVHRL